MPLLDNGSILLAEESFRKIRRQVYGGDFRFRYGGQEFQAKVSRHHERHVPGRNHVNALSPRIRGIHEELPSVTSRRDDRCLHTCRNSGCIRVYLVTDNDPVPHVDEVKIRGQSEFRQGLVHKTDTSGEGGLRIQGRDADRLREVAVVPERTDFESNLLPLDVPELCTDVVEVELLHGRGAEARAHRAAQGEFGAEVQLRGDLAVYRTAEITVVL